MHHLRVAVAVASLLLSSELAAAEPPTESVDQDIRRLSDAAQRELRFTGTTKQEFAAWRIQFRDKLLELLGDIEPPPKWTVVERSRVTLDDHVRLELLLQAPGTPSLPMYLLIPGQDNAAARLPAVLCVHGHGDYGYHPIVGRRDLEGVAEAIEKANYDYGLQFVRRGYVVAAPCMIPFGPRVEKKKYGSDPCAVTFVRMQAFGKLPMAAQVVTFLDDESAPAKR